MTTAHHVSLNRAEYGERYPLLKFPTRQQAEEAEAHRRELLAAIGTRASLGCGGTKIDVRRLSPGCAICVAGRWSCLFINGRCNARCFYCPSSQEDIGEPTTNALTFRNAADYAEYIGAFGFTGASFSGGEPLLTPERTLAYLEAVKKRHGAGVHAWLYTNGTLVDAEIIARLREAGLDEIRFDIGAIGYSLEKVGLAVGRIPTVTVEIPAVPEERLLMSQKLVEMADRGVGHLNLHQLRLTPYNFQRFQGRGYTFLHGEKVTVLESELAALDLIRESLDQGIDLPVNYCSFVYKNRYQRQAARLRNAAFVIKGWEDLTEAGCIRTLTLQGAVPAVARQLQRLRHAGIDPRRYSLNRAGDRLSLPAELLPREDAAGLGISITYSAAQQLERVSYRNPFVEVRLETGTKIILERRPLCAETLLGEDPRGDRIMTLLEQAPWIDFEKVQAGLARYG
jgi:pyruvate formate-lyase activating enzyme-like uncharacterized protein